MLASAVERGLDTLPVNPSVSAPPALRSKGISLFGSDHTHDSRTRTTLFVKRDSVVSPIPLVLDMGRMTDSRPIRSRVLTASAATEMKEGCLEGCEGSSPMGMGHGIPANYLFFREGREVLTT
jgi:hypothetical protein